MGSWRAGVWAASCVAGMALVFGDPGAVAQQRVVAAMPAAAAMPCGGAELARGGAGDALDGGNFQISDGSIVHLAGIEVPMASGIGKAFAGPGGMAATAELSGLISGAQVVLR